MATILQLRSGRWQARVRRADAPATSRTFHTKFDAEAWARKQESEQERGVWRDSSESERTTLAQAFERYAREVTPRKRAQNTERSNLRVLAEERIARLALARVGSHDIAALRDAWMAEGLKPASIKRRMVTLSHVFTVAAREWNMVGLHNPVRAITLVPENNARERRVTDAEIEAICAATGSAGLAVFIRLAVETAMRRGELCALRWKHVNLGACTAHLPHEITKNGYARDVPLSSRAIEILRALPRRIDGRVLGLQPDSVTQAFERAAERVGLDGARFHDLRHEAISRLAPKFQMHELAKITGQRDPRMLMRYYHPCAEDLAKRMG